LNIQPSAASLNTWPKEPQAAFAAHFAGQIKTGIPMQAMEDEAEESLSNTRRRSRFARTVELTASKQNSPTPEPIAICGNAWNNSYG